jgi:hypothetical protein
VKQFVLGERKYDDDKKKPCSHVDGHKLQSAAHGVGVQRANEENAFYFTFM